MGSFVFQPIYVIWTVLGLALIIVILSVFPMAKAKQRFDTATMRGRPQLLDKNILGGRATITGYTKLPDNRVLIHLIDGSHKYSIPYHEWQLRPFKTIQTMCGDQAMWEVVPYEETKTGSTRMFTSLYPTFDFPTDAEKNNLEKQGGSFPKTNTYVPNQRQPYAPAAPTVERDNYADYLAEYEQQKRKAKVYEKESTDLRKRQMQRDEDMKEFTLKIAKARDEARRSHSANTSQSN